MNELNKQYKNKIEKINRELCSMIEYEWDNDYINKSNYKKLENELKSLRLKVLEMEN